MIYMAASGRNFNYPLLYSPILRFRSNFCGCHHHHHQHNDTNGGDDDNGTTGHRSYGSNIVKESKD